MKLLSLILLSILASCEMPNVFNLFDEDDNNSDRSGTTVDDGVVTEVSGASLTYPSSNSSLHRTPTITVSGVVSGDSVGIYDDSACSNSVGSASASGTTVEVETSSLSVGSYTFYVNRTPSGGEASACTAVSLSYTVNACPTGAGDFILVPGNSDYHADDFCVAKYEMRDNAGTAVSQATSTPTVSITKANAITECTDLGANYNLISNAQWQTIARNIESVPSNWENGVIGQDFLNTGHSDNNPSSICDSQVENVTTDCSTLDTSFKQKRTHTLTNSEVIWDLSGNVFEWVKDDNSVGTQYDSSGGYIYLLTESSPSVTGALDDGVNRNAKGQFGPSGDYSTTLTSNPFGGLGYLDNPNIASGANHSIYRGSSIGSGFNLSGVFSASISAGTGSTNLGYRCVYTE